MGILFLCVNVVRPDCNYLSFGALGETQQALVQACIQPQCTSAAVYALHPYLGQPFVCRLKGYAGSASLFSYSSGHTLLERHASTPRAAGNPSRAPQTPLLAAHQALKAAVALCQRHSLEASQDIAQQLWFEVLQVRCHVAILHNTCTCLASYFQAYWCTYCINVGLYQTHMASITNILVSCRRALVKQQHAAMY